MPKVRDFKLETATARLKLPVAKRPYWKVISPGIALGYRRNDGAGTWSVRSTAQGAQWIKRIAIADDLEQADGKTVLTYWQAIDTARALVRTGSGETVETRPITVGDALDAYKDDLITRNGDPYNADRAGSYLPAALLTKAVRLTAVKDWKQWRATLVAKMAPASANRTMSCMRAALTLAADDESNGISSRQPWEIGLKPIPGANRARKMVLDDATVRRIVYLAYEHDRAFGLMVETAAQTGARQSQFARLVVEDLLDGSAQLMMPRSDKGGHKNRGEKNTERVPVPISPALAAALKAGARGRIADAPLLLNGKGEAWGHSRKNDAHRRAFRTVVEAAGLDPATITLYALRHSSIVRAILAGTPVLLVAKNHDTSVKEIETHYARWIAEAAAKQGDRVARLGLLDTNPNNIVPFAA